MDFFEKQMQEQYQVWIALLVGVMLWAGFMTYSELVQNQLENSFCEGHGFEDYSGNECYKFEDDIIVKREFDCFNSKCAWVKVR